MVVHGEPGARLVDCVVHPQAYLAAGGRLQLHGQYYITKQILPALDRLFSLLGADVHEWFSSMSKPQRLLPHKRPLSMLPSRARPHPCMRTAQALLCGPTAPGCSGNAMHTFCLPAAAGDGAVVMGQL